MPLAIRSLACSFCHRPESRVAKLVAGPRMLFLGPRVYICDTCADQVQRIMAGPVQHPELPAD